MSAISYVLIVWLGTIDNFAEHTTFQTKEQCVEKRDQLRKALNQAGSQMKADCRVRHINKIHQVS